MCAGTACICGFVRARWGVMTTAGIAGLVFARGGTPTACMPGLLAVLVMGERPLVTLWSPDG